jgi:hypothetical protein
MVIFLNQKIIQRRFLQHILFPNFLKVLTSMLRTRLGAMKRARRHCLQRYKCNAGFQFIHIAWVTSCTLHAFRQNIPSPLVLDSYKSLCILVSAGKGKYRGQYSNLTIRGMK